MIIEASDNSGYKLEIAEGIASLLNPDQEMLCEFMIEEPENENKWIRAEDKMPEDGEDVLVGSSISGLENIRDYSRQ